MTLPRHVDLNRNSVSRNGQTTYLTADVAELLWALEDSDGRFVPMEKMRLALWGAMSSKQTPVKWQETIKAHIYSARHLVQPLGGCIQNQRGGGYRLVWLSDQAKAA
jgi:DNA-binding response OmpR family regulator